MEGQEGSRVGCGMGNGVIHIRLYMPHTGFFQAFKMTVNVAVVGLI